MSYRIKFLEIIEYISYLNIATVNEEGIPHNTAVYTAYDEKYNFYWKSWTENIHSKNIENNSECFVTLYDSTVPAGTGVGIYMKGLAKKIEDEDTIDFASKLLSGRQGKIPRTASEHMFAYPRRIYKFTPEKVWINGDDTIQENFIDIRIDITEEIIQR